MRLSQNLQNHIKQNLKLRLTFEIIYLFLGASYAFPFVDYLREDSKEEFLRNMKDSTYDPVTFNVKLKHYDGKYLDVYLKEMEALPSYTEEEIIKAKVRAVFDDDEEAQAVLLNHYLKDVVDIAKLYIYQSLPAEDLIGEGNIGLMTAIKALATLESVDEVEPFVGKLIMDAMDKAIYEDTDIRRQAEELADRVNDIDEKAKKFSDEMKRPVTAMELAEETGMPLEEIIEAMRLTGDQIEGLVPIKQEGS